jgi:hypothetical protein
LGDEDQVAALADGVDDGVGVVRQSGGVVVTWQIHGDGVVATLEQQRDDPVPVPRVRPGAVNQDICRSLHAR